MTREEILKEYKIENGTIRSPGKFEGERVYVPYFWDILLDGLAEVSDEDEEGAAVSFTVSEEDIAEFPELVEDDFTLGTELHLFEREDGFVFQATRSSRKRNDPPLPEAWAEAIAARIADEWTGKDSDPDNAELLKEVLTKALKAVPEETMKLVGTGIIEEGYFEEVNS